MDFDTSVKLAIYETIARTTQAPMRPLLTLDQLWFLAQTWYGNRLTVDSRRPGPDEMVGIFKSIGLEGPFWDPRSDQW
jgi:hypothetical protein